MARFDPSKIGEDDDKVRIVLNDETVLIVESYQVKVSVFTQPAAWSLRLGHAGVVAELLRKYPPRTPFKLYIGANLQQTGWTDTPGCDENASATSFTLRGRDAMAPLHDDIINEELAFKDDTYTALVRKQLDAVGLADRKLVTSNRANRQIRAGVPITELEPPKTVDEILTETGVPPSGGIAHQTIQARLGERRYDFLVRYLRLAGLFLWASADGNFVLSEPNARQKPVGRIVRALTRGADGRPAASNVVSAFFENGTEHRYARYNVYGRGAGRAGGHPKAIGTFEDQEMIGWGFTKQKSIRAKNARSKDQAVFIAQRSCAEDRRAGYQLRYTFSGHTTMSFIGWRTVWTPDTVWEVADELRGVFGNFYLSDATYARSPQTTTEITLERPEDLIFGGEDAEA